MLGIATISNETRETLVAELEDLALEGDLPEEKANEIINLVSVLAGCDKVMIRNENTTGSPWA